MALTYPPQFSSVQRYDNLETAPDTPVPQISILVDQSVSRITEPENNPVQNDMAGLNPSQQVPDSSSRSPKKVAADAPKHEHNTFGKLDAEYPRFGPCHRVDADTKLVEAAKNDAWQLVESKTIEAAKNDAGQQDKSKTKDVEECKQVRNDYRNVIKKVEKEARDFYGDPIVKPLKKKFREIMRIDGCFFLQLALLILGYSKQLGFSEDHVYFGKNGNEESKTNEQPNWESKTRKWIRAMFSVGNQIPCVVLKELMKQSFFKEVIREETCNLPLDLPQLALYSVVIHPFKKNAPGPLELIFSKLNWQKTPDLPDTPSDVLHCLHTLVLGTWHCPLDPQDSKIEEDLESGMEEPNEKNKFPSASEIKELGIKLRKADRGIRKIHFTKRYLLLGYLYVPPFKFNEDTKLMLTNLKSYEERQQEGKANREVSSNLRLMRDLIQTPRDVELLQAKKILEVEEKGGLKVDLPGWLSRNVLSEEVSFTDYLRLTRFQVKGYTEPPWYLINLALIFTLVQTVFTTLQYFAPHA